MQTGSIDEDAVLLVRRLHDGFPLCECPYAEVAAELGWTEAQVITRLRRLLADGTLAYFGPLAAPASARKAQMLAALQVPDVRFETVAALLDAMPAVVQNVRREHAFNMWFVLQGASARALRATCGEIEAQSGLRVYVFPRQKEFFVAWRLSQD
ncbi:MAG: Lrp/AsnC family transcriptional regulator [Burkholderiaceae bacterium]